MIDDVQARDLARELDLARSGLERQRLKIDALEEANAQLEELVFQRSLLNRISQVAQSEVDVAPIARSTLELVGHVLQAPAAGVLAWDGRQQALYLSPGASPEFDMALRTAWRLADSDVGPELPTGDALFVPIRRGHNLLGMLGAELPVPTQIDPRQFDILGLFARELGPLLERGFAVARVKEAYEARLEFVRSLTHDLRNPLTGILSTMLSLTDTTLTFRPEVVGHLTQNAMRSARQLDRMLDDLLDVYLSEAGKLEIEAVRTDIGKAVQDAAGYFNEAARAANLALDLAIPADLPSVCADERLIGRVAANLLANAVKFTPAGMVRVSAAARADGTVMLRVDDTGRGIPDAARKHLFTPFYREPSAAHEVPGTGLGLAFCKGAVEGMGGKIWYERSPLGGSAFCVALPTWVD